MVIYLITNLINGKQYVGQTKKSLNGRWLQHCDPLRPTSALGKAIQKYGKEAFKKEILFTHPCLETINELEQEFIAHYGTRAKNGYNIHPGGNNHQWTEEVKQAFSKARMGTGNPRYGYRGPTHTVESREKLRQLRLGKKPTNQISIMCVESGVLYPSMQEAARQLGLQRSKISQVCAGNRRSTGNLTFRKIGK